jgi:transposase
MWRLLEMIALAGIVLVSVTEFFYPLIAGKPFFGSFRRRQQRETRRTEGPLDQKVSEAKEKVEEIKNVQREVDKHYKSAEQLKEESDQLLNNRNRKSDDYSSFNNN